MGSARQYQTEGSVRVAHRAGHFLPADVREQNGGPGHDPRSTTGVRRDALDGAGWAGEHVPGDSEESIRYAVAREHWNTEDVWQTRRRPVGPWTLPGQGLLTRAVPTDTQKDPLGPPKWTHRPLCLWTLRGRRLTLPAMGAADVSGEPYSATALAREMELTSDAIAGVEDLSEMLRRLAARARALVSADYAAVSTFDDAGILSRFVYDGIEDRIARRLGQPPVGRGLLGELARREHPLRVADLSGHHFVHGLAR